MAVNLSSISNSTNTARSLSNLILARPQVNLGIKPQDLIGNETQEPKSFLFHYQGEDVLSLNSDITDHYTEENSAINDQISLKPETIRTQGFIGELNNVPPVDNPLVKTALEKLTAIGAYQPELSISAQILYNRAVQTYDTALKISNSAVSTWSSVTGDGGPTVISGNESAQQFLDNKSKSQDEQQKAFSFFYGYWKNRTLFTVQTPWAIFKNMAIQNINAIQDSETRMITQFDVTFKIIRYAQTVQEFIGGERQDASQYQNRGRPSVSEQINKVSTPLPSIPLSQQLGAIA